MNVLRILILCLTAALICAAIRTQHPQIASAVSLAVGVAALGLSLPDIKVFSDAAKQIESGLTDASGGMLLLKLCGIALVAEFASDICRDSGEAALARRIDTGTKLAMLASALPLASDLLQKLSALLP